MALCGTFFVQLTVLGSRTGWLREAQTSVRGIKKKDLDEVRNLARPPNNVKLTLECVAIMMGEKKVEWAEKEDYMDYNPT